MPRACVTTNQSRSSCWKGSVRGTDAFFGGKEAATGNTSAARRLFKRWIALSTGWISIHSITQLESITLIRWIAIYPVDSAIQRLNNRGLKDRNWKGRFFPRMNWTTLEPRFNEPLFNKRELKNHDDDRKWVSVYCASATSKFRRRGVVDDAKQSTITSSCNPQASAGINPLF